MKTSVNGKYYLSYKIDSGKETFIAAYKVLRKQETKENMNGRVVSDIQIQAEGEICKLAEFGIRYIRLPIKHLFLSYFLHELLNSSLSIITKFRCLSNIYWKFLETRIF